MKIHIEGLTITLHLTLTSALLTSAMHICLMDSISFNYQKNMPLMSTDRCAICHALGMSFTHLLKISHSRNSYSLVFHRPITTYWQHLKHLIIYVSTQYQHFIKCLDYFIHHALLSNYKIVDFGSVSVPNLVPRIGTVCS